MTTAPFWSPSSRASAQAASCTSPGEIRRQTGRPFASTRAWIFVLMPPRLRPTQRSPLFFGTGGMLMHAHDRAVDHLHLAVVSLDDSVHQAIPDAGLAPPIEAVVGRGIGPVSFGKIAPRCACAQNPENAVENTPIVLELHAAPVLRQQRLDDAPLEVCKIVAHDP